MTRWISADDARKDGTEYLLWVESTNGAKPFAFVGAYHHGGWLDIHARIMRQNVTYARVIDPPDED